MCNTNVLILCRFNGRLTRDRNNNPNYVNGIVKLMVVGKSITRHELIEKAHRITKTNPNEHQCHLTCKWPIAHEKYQAVGKSVIIIIVLCLNCKREEHTIELYVEKDIVIHREPEVHGQFTRMLDLNNESTSFISLIHNTQVFVNKIMVYTILFSGENFLTRLIKRSISHHRE